MSTLAAKSAQERHPVRASVSPWEKGSSVIKFNPDDLFFAVLLLRC